MLKALVAASIAPLLLMTACSESAPRSGPEAADGLEGVTPSTVEGGSGKGKQKDEAARDLAPLPLKPCEAIVFAGRRYLLTHRPDGAGPGVGRPLGTAEAIDCRPMRVKVYSVNEQPKDEALAVSDGKTVRLYTAIRA